MKKIIVFTIFVFSFFIHTQEIKAIYDPLSVPNNKFGIHIQSESDLKDAARLVNSSFGDWGYVTLVITEAERDANRWQKVFDEMRRLHLIPIVRLATKFENGVWTIPQTEEIDNWVIFLNSLNWVVKNRYIIIGNEPNHAKEWGGKIDPQGYAAYFLEFAQKLKTESSDFFVLLAGFDASAPDSLKTMDETKFISQMIKTFPNIFDYIDGWVSHSYPNPAFKGKETDSGRGTIKTFEWETDFLKSQKINKKLPIFITETGWSSQNLKEEEIAEKLEYAFEKVWTDEKIVAVTPFILNYPQFPFAEFSWKKGEGGYYLFFDKVSEIKKIKGNPIQIIKGQILTIFINPFLLTKSHFRGVVLAQNLGQSIWINSEVEIKDQSATIELTTEPFSDLEPKKFNLIYFTGIAPDNPGKYRIGLILKSKNEVISEKHDFQLIVVKPAEITKLNLITKIQIWIKRFLISPLSHGILQKSF